MLITNVFGIGATSVTIKNREKQIERKKKEEILNTFPFAIVQYLKPSSVLKIIKYKYFKNIKDAK